MIVPRTLHELSPVICRAPVALSSQPSRYTETARGLPTKTLKTLKRCVDWEGHSKRTHPDWEGHSKRTHPTGKDTARRHTPTGKDTARRHTRLGRTQQEDTPRLGRTQQEDTPRLGRTTPRGITAASRIQTENLVSLTQRSFEVGRGMDKAANHSTTNRTHGSRLIKRLPLAMTAWSSAV